MGNLNKTRTYLVGHMQYASGRDWRDYVEGELEPLGIRIFNPYKNWEGIAGIDASIRAPKKEQFLNTMSQFPSKGGISPLFESAVESWKPTQLRHNIDLFHGVIFQMIHIFCHGLSM